MHAYTVSALSVKVWPSTANLNRTVLPRKAAISFIRSLHHPKT